MQFASSFEHLQFLVICQNFITSNNVYSIGVGRLSIIIRLILSLFLEWKAKVRLLLYNDTIFYFMKFFKSFELVVKPAKSKVTKQIFSLTVTSFKRSIKRCYYLARNVKLQSRVYCITLHVSIHMFQFLDNVIWIDIPLNKWIIWAAAHRNKNFIN